MADPSELAQQVARGSLFRGRHCVTGNGEPLEAAVGGTVLPAGGGSTVGWQLCRSHQELVQSLHGGSALGIGLGPLQLLQAKQAFRDSLKTTAFSLSLVVWARQVAAALDVGQTHLLDGFAVPGGPAELEAFVALHGDGFVAAAEVGGECHGVFTFYAQSREQARLVEREFEAGLGLGGLALTPALVETVTTVARTAAVNVGFRMQVIGSRAQPPAEAASLIPFARDFAGLPLDQPALIGVRTRGYESVPAIGAAFRAVATNRQLFSGEGPGEGLLERRERLEGLIHQMDWVADTYRLYAVAADPSLAIRRAVATADLAALDACRSAYAAAATAPLEAPQLPSLAAGSPELNVTLGEELPMGGNGGAPFAFPGRAGAIRQRRHLVEVALRTGSRVDQIQLRYAGEGDPLEAEVHGGGGGGDRGRLELGQGVVIRRIEALSGTRVDRLFLTSSDGQRIGGGGEAGDRLIDWTVPADSAVLGFSGRSGRELDGLRVVVARFGPLIWQPLEAVAKGP
ncbi:jacalin-like lectin [Cyanobium gracile]|uniref:Jacalin-type lectin domain-containing protein n=1 Tax=Cyanobium gracile UHCC 0281 TaxID=3110309 RepID=A0ABU5T107_9CYAN|nr:hypothetical protein [Cyanobium gracile]MEA5443967.1 hypothetical protein [Cyanobium gracile UHCC 0281]